MNKYSKYFQAKGTRTKRTSTVNSLGGEWGSWNEEVTWVSSSFKCEIVQQYWVGRGFTYWRKTGHTLSSKVERLYRKVLCFINSSWPSESHNFNKLDLKAKTSKYHFCWIEEMSCFYLNWNYISIFIHKGSVAIWIAKVYNPRIICLSGLSSG